ncbi:hypothetical protein [Rubrivirga sp.]|uniref:hypothetical protein n=1 Tax=Rubrivirga sp. TaxID=1885344 RepID=UPI003C785508
MGLFSSKPASHFPVVKGRRLSDGEDVSIPHDLPADATLLIVAFQDALDPLSDQWARLGDRLAAVHGDRFAVWEVPVLTTALKHLGGLGTMGVRHQVESDEERDRTVPLFVDVKVFRKSLKLKSNDVYALLVARDGRIAWRGDGDIDLDEVTALEAATEELLDAPIPSPTDHPDLEAKEEPAEDQPVEDESASDDTPVEAERDLEDDAR